MKTETRYLINTTEQGFIVVDAQTGEAVTPEYSDKVKALTAQAALLNLVNEKSKGSQTKVLSKSETIIKTSSKPVYGATAFGLSQRPGSMTWDLVKISYDPVSKQVGTLTTVSAGDSRMEAEERFKINVVEEVFTHE